MCLSTWGCTTTTIVQEVAADAGAGDDGGAGDDDGGLAGDADADAPDAPHQTLAPRCTQPRAPDPSPGDAGAPTGFFATHPLPQLANNGGPILANPRIVPVFFAGDDMASDLEDFVASVGCTDYWRQAVGEYGIGDALATPAVHVAESAPASASEDDVESWLTKKLTTSGSGFPAPTKDTVYVVFYPETSTLTEGGGTSCQEFGGYHTEFTLPSGQHVAYAAIPRCAHFAELSMKDSVTGSASHEIIESATDPYNKETPAYAYTDEDHLAWAFVIGGESGDLCAQEPDAFYEPSGYPFTVQRNWSNRAAAAGGYPCRPASGASFFTAAPKLADEVDLYQGTMTKGVSVPAGSSKTIDLDLYADQPDATIQVQVMDASGALGGAGSSTYSLDRSSGKSGETLHLTVTTPAGAPSQSDIFMVYAWTGSVARVAWAGAVGH